MFLLPSAIGAIQQDPLRRIFKQASLDLQFAEKKSLVDATTGQNLVTFTRASSGTFVGSDGLIKTAVTNLLLQSEDFSTTWSTQFSASVTSNQAVAPNGTNTADLLVISSSNRFSGIRQTFTFSPSVTYTFSCWVRAVSGTAAFALKIYDGVSDTFSSNLSVTESWQRFSFTTTTAVGAGTGNFQIANISSPLLTQNLYIWGAQLEQSSTVGEYIPTTSTINSAPRFDHNPTTGESLGLLVEENRTNSLVQSEDFSTTWTQSNVTVTTNTVTAPDGTTTADTFGPIVGDGLTTTRFLRQNPALTTQQAYTLSVFVKVGTATTNGIALYVSDQTATNSFRANFNLFTLATTALSTGWATPTSTIIPYPNGWYRCILSGVTSTAHTSLRAIIYLNFFGTTADTYGTIHIWGAQLEAGAFPTSYIPTTTATVTRSADVASISGSNFSGWYRQDEGTVFADVPGIYNTAAAFTLSDGTNNNRILLDHGTNTRRSRIVTGGADQASLTSSYVYGSPIKSTVAYALDNSALASNGSLTANSPDTSCTIPTAIDRLNIGSNAAPAAQAGTSIRRLTYWPQRLPNSTLQTITQ